jgi:uncharacterized spore protein YtfJ
MSEIKNETFLSAIQTPAEGLTLLGKLTDAASPRAVFSEPVQQGETTLITANSITVGLGFGIGGFVLKRQAEDPQERQEVNGGGGGGGSSRARPVAVISVSPEGVRVDPIIDITKICLAFFSAFSAVLIALFKIKKFL